jgi:predicted ATPase
LVSIVGVGGIGKTRLAIEVARRRFSSYARGTWFCDLAALSDARLVASAVAAACGLAPQAGDDPVETIASALSGGAVLLVLDNCEHVLEAAAGLAAALLDRCPQVAILATSRRRLGVKGETAIALAPLALPDAATSDANDAAGFGAVALFCERAANARPDFALTPESVADAVEICRRLDGIPLAIELAAAQMRVLNVREVLRLLDEHRALRLPSFARSPARHRTLEAALDWSYDLLPERARRLLRALSIFAARFRFDAVRAVCAPDEDDLEVLSSLGELCDASLVVADPADDEEATEFRLLETTRSYASARLGAGERDAIAARHLAYCRTRADKPASDLQLADARAAIGWALKGGDVAGGAALAGRLGGRWERNGLTLEGVGHIEAALAAMQDGDPEITTRLWTALAFLLGNAKRFDEGFVAAQHAADDARRCAPEPGVAIDALRALAVFSAYQRRDDDADRALTEAERLVELVATPRNLMRVSFTRAQVSELAGRLDAATEAFEGARSLAEESDDRYAAVSADVSLAIIERRRGEPAAGIARLRRLSEELLDPIDRLLVLANLTWHLAMAGARADTVATARDFFAAVPDPRVEHLVGNVVECLALAHALDGAYEPAARLCGFATAWFHRRSMQREPPDVESRSRLEAILAAQLDDDDRVRMEADGAGMAVEAAMQEAIRM